MCWLKYWVLRSYPHLPLCCRIELIQYGKVTGSQDCTVKQRSFFWDLCLNFVKVLNQFGSRATHSCSLTTTESLFFFFFMEMFWFWWHFPFPVPILKSGWIWSDTSSFFYGISKYYTTNPSLMLCHGFAISYKGHFVYIGYLICKNIKLHTGVGLFVLTSQY